MKLFILSLEIFLTCHFSLMERDVLREKYLENCSVGSDNAVDHDS